MAKEVDVSTEIIINRGRDVVSDYTMNPDNAPAWYENIKSVEWETAPPLRRGSRLSFVAQFLGRRLSYTYEITEYVPHERMVMRTAEGPFPMETTYAFEPVSSAATRVRLRNRGMPAGFSRLVAPLMASAMRRANIKDLGRLKHILEH